MNAQALRRPLSFVDRVALLWFLIDSLTHLTVEASYVYFTLADGGAARSAHPAAYLWREYGRADARWAVYDPTVLSLELLTVLLAGPLALACAFAIWTRQPWRHLACVVISVMELYGGAMTFFPEWLSGSTALSSDPFLQFVYLFFFNALWVWVPAIVAYDSGAKIVAACDTAKTEASDKSAAGWGWWAFILATIVVYSAVVTAVILTSRA